jgi:carbamoyl-phosphate synthase small subunit
VNNEAALVFADGTVFEGRAVGATGSKVGEVVFNTSMTGYQEILTDPSYHQQIVVLTTAHVGNVGTNSDDAESAATHLSGLVVRDVPTRASNWRCEQSLPEYLRANNLIAISDIDTRAITRKLRREGAMNACIVASDGTPINREAALEQARAFKGLAGADLARVVTTVTPYPFTTGVLEGFRAQDMQPIADGPKRRVVAYDFGVKRNILRILVDLGCEVEVVPATTPASEVLAQNPDGVFFSNGPGDPEPVDYGIAAARAFMDAGVPLFGICLGHQILALALGARTEKMKFGHHGANHPVQDLASGRVFITSQNHGFTVADDSLDAHIEVTHRSLFDGTIQGIRHAARPAYGFQGHPEASPGPHDIQHVFKPFLTDIAAYRGKDK